MQCNGVVVVEVGCNNNNNNNKNKWTSGQQLQCWWWRWGVSAAPGQMLGVHSCVMRACQPTMHYVLH